MSKITPDFSYHEFYCPCDEEACSRNVSMHLPLVRLLQEGRMFLDVPLIVSSGIRCPRHNKSVGGNWNSTHLTGHGVDIAPKENELLPSLFAYFLNNGAEGLGLYEEHIHVDLGKRGHQFIWIGLGKVKHYYR